MGVNRYLPSLVVNHHVVRLNVSVHNAFRVAIVQGLPDLKVRVTSVCSEGEARTLRSSNM
jgi:hypothetical protein